MSAFLQVVGTVKAGEFTRHAPVSVAAQLEVDGVVRSGLAVFTSEVAVGFTPGFDAALGTSGTLRLAGGRHVMAVRITEAGSEGVQIQPPLGDDARRRLRGLLDELGAGGTAAPPLLEAA